MSALPASAGDRLSVLASEGAKLPAFLRRDFLAALSYRMIFFTDALALALQAILFFYVGKLVEPDALPAFGGRQVSYFEFVVVGIAISMVIAVGLFRAAAAFRNEQLMGTLEVLLMTPTSPVTIQVGSVVYDLLYVPLRTGLFFVVVALTAPVDINPDGILLAFMTLLLFVPFVWGLGILYAAATLTFKVAGGGFAVTILTLTSGAFFPLSLFPDWLVTVAELNPMALVVETMRESLLGDARWSDVSDAFLVLAPAALVTLAVGVASFRAAMRRERRRGSLGLY